MKRVLFCLLISIPCWAFSQGNSFAASELMQEGGYRPVRVWVTDSLIFVAVSSLSEMDISHSSSEDFIKLSAENFIIPKDKIFEIYHSPKKNREPGKEPSATSIVILSVPSAFNKKERHEFILSTEATDQAVMELLLKRS